MAVLLPIQHPLKPVRGTADTPRLCEVRTAEDRDAHGLLGLCRELAREPIFTVYEPDEVVRTLEGERLRIAKYRESAGRLLLVAQIGGELAGELTFRAGRYRRLARAGDLGMSVSVRWRGRGVGRALLASAIDWARSDPVIEKINLRVFANNERALALYRSMGFTEEGRRAREIRIGPGVYVDDISMARFVKC